MTYPFDDEAYNLMPYGAPAPFGFGGGILQPSRAPAKDDVDSAGDAFPESTIGLGFRGSMSSGPTWQVASSEDPTYPYPRPGYAPSLPDFFGRWRRYSVPAHEDLWRFLFQDGFGWGSSGGNRNGPGCKEEWKDAREFCEKQLSAQDPSEQVYGNLQKSTEDCAKGIVSEACGGDRYKRVPIRRFLPKRYKLD
jgi:hypothetical protein